MKLVENKKMVKKINTLMMNRPISYSRRFYGMECIPQLGVTRNLTFTLKVKVISAIYCDGNIKSGNTRVRRVNNAFRHRIRTDVYNMYLKHFGLSSSFLHYSAVSFSYPKD